MKILKSPLFYTKRKKCKAGILAAIPVLIAAGLILALQLPPRAAPAGIKPSVMATASSPVAAPSPSAAAPSQSPAVRQYLAKNGTVALVMFGEEIHEFILNNDTVRGIVDDAIFDGMIKSTLYPGADVDSLDDRIILTVQIGDGEKPRTYTVYDQGGKHMIQDGDDLASTLGEKAYLPLKELAMGYRLPEAVTVISGKNIVHAFGGAVSSQRKADGLSADMRRYTPRQLADRIDYLTLDPDGREPFTPYRNGKKLYGFYTVFDSQFNEVKHINPSGLAPQTYLFANTQPGKYIVRLETAYDDDEFTYQMQYYFGVNFK